MSCDLHTFHTVLQVMLTFDAFDMATVFVFHGISISV